MFQIDKLVDFMSAMKPHFVNDESIYNEYLFDAKCLFKHVCNTVGRGKFAHICSH